MYGIKSYINRGGLFLNNNYRPSHKKLATLMFYATDRCDSVCKHCFIWKKKPKLNMSMDKIIEIMNSKVVTKNTLVGLEGGEFLLHPEAMEIMTWLSANHPHFDLLSNCVNPKRTIEAVKKSPPERLYISLDGAPDTVEFMRGVKKGYENVIEVIEALRNVVPISVMFTLTPYNTFEDMKLVGEVCKKYNIDMRIGIYNDIAYFETEDKAHDTEFGEKAQEEGFVCDIDNVPDIVKEFPENYDFLVLYDEWRKKNLKLNCYSIQDSLVVLPNGDVPICQNLDHKLGNVFNESLDEILNKQETIDLHKKHKTQCNGCWINFHRKYDVVLYRNMEKLFPKALIQAMVGDYHWSENKSITYSNYLRKKS